MNSLIIGSSCNDVFASCRQQLVDCILKIAKPDKVFLLGTSVCSRKTESIFGAAALSSAHLADCFLLILMPGFANREPHEWHDKIETHCSAILPVTTLVLQTATFHEWLQAAHSFATIVCRSATLIYDAGNMDWDIPPQISTTPGSETEKFFTCGLQKASEFLAGAELFRLRRQNTLAAFMLHQSVEQSLRHGLKAATGYHCNTHSIDGLLRYTTFVSTQLTDIFSSHSSRDKHLLQLLQKAYIDTRYRADYTISDNDLLCLLQKARQVLQLAMDLGKSIFNTVALPLTA